MTVFERGDIITKYALENKATHFLTLKMGMICRAYVDTRRHVVSPISVVFREYARCRNALPKRVRVELEHLPFLVGAIERTDRFGNLDPHLHAFISLEDGEEPYLRGFLRDRFGRDCTGDAATLDAFVHIPNDEMFSPRVFGPKRIGVTDRPSRRIILRNDVDPSFDLQKLGENPEYVGRYIMKKSDTVDVITHNHLVRPCA